MQTTANLGLRKPEDTDPVAIQDFNDNADIIDREMAKKAEKTGDGSEMTAKFNEASGLANLVSGEKLSTSFGKLMKAVAELVAHLANKSNPHVVTKSQVGLGSVDNTSDANKPVSTKQQAALNAKVTASGGDIANTRITNFVTSSESYPIPAANDTVGVGFGKIKKFFEDIRNTTTGACFIGQIVNNCVTNNAKLPLSAAQGKVLMDLYAKLNSDYAVLNTKLTAMNTYNALELPETRPKTTTEIQVGNSMQISAGLYFVFLNMIARSNSSLATEILLKYDKKGFALGRIPNTSGTHMNICLNIVVRLPESTITCYMSRSALDGEVVAFGGTLNFIRLQ